MAHPTPVERPAPGLLGRFVALELLDNRYPMLHGLRVFGIVSVLQWHVTQSFVFDAKLPLSPSWSAPSFAVFFGMDLFFVLSGFLIGSILLRSVAKSGFANIRRFYLRRAFRTFPSYYVALTYLTLTTALTATQRQNLPFEYAYLTNYRPGHRSDFVMSWGWSLAVEEHFYFAIPLLFFLLHKLRTDRGRLMTFGVLWASAFIFRLALCLRHPERMWEAYVATHTRLDTLVAGVFLAYVHQRWGDSLTVWLRGALARATLAVPSLGCLWVLLHPDAFGGNVNPPVGVFFWGTLTSIMYVGFVLLLLHGGDGWMRRMLSAPWFRQVATLGYGVYLVHIPVCKAIITPVAVALAGRRGWPPELVWVMAVAGLVLGSLVVAYVLHVVVEKPSLRLRDRLAG